MPLQSRWSAIPLTHIPQRSFSHEETHITILQRKQLHAFYMIMVNNNIIWLRCMLKVIDMKIKIICIWTYKKITECDQELALSQTAEKSWAPWGRDTQHRLLWCYIIKLASFSSKTTYLLHCQGHQEPYNKTRTKHQSPIHNWSNNKLISEGGRGWYFASKVHILNTLYKLNAY